MRIVIVGAGIAGLTLAYWLERFGFEPLVLERAPAVRGSGYLIYFYGKGFDVADRMGLVPALARHHLAVPELTFVDERGRKSAALDLHRFRDIVNGRYFNFLRGDLESVLYEAVRHRVEVRFGSKVCGVEERPGHLELSLETGAGLRADVLLGADGIRSAVRRRLWGDDAHHVRHLDYQVTFATIEGLTAAQGFYCHRVPGRMVTLYSIGQRRHVAFFIARRHGRAVASARERRRFMLDAFADVGWRVPELVELSLASKSFYSDGLSQILLSRWWRGRAALLGDSCHCPTLLSGQGASLAMVGAYLLALELSRAVTAKEPVQLAFERYQRKLRSETLRRQHLVRTFPRWLIPDNLLGIHMQDLYMKMPGLPGMGLILAYQDGFRRYSQPPLSPRGQEATPTLRSEPG